MYVLPFPFLRTYCEQANEHYIRVIDQACSVKMAGYWPRSFLYFFFIIIMEKEHLPIFLPDKASNPELAR